MKQIEKLSAQIDDELHDAEKYAKCALHNKEDHPQLARMYHDLAQEEVQHSDRLHTAAVELINEYRRAHGDPPKEMQWVYDFLHEKHIDSANAVKMLIEEF